MKLWDLKCAACSETVKLVRLDSEHPEAPTLVSPADPDQDPWFGVVKTDTEDGVKIDMIVCCSNLCAQNLLEE